MPDNFAPGAVWKHRKGNLYFIVGLAKGCDSNESGLEGQEVVVYRAVTEQAMYCRLKSEFCDGRFTPVEDDVNTTPKKPKTMPSKPGKGVSKP